MTVWMVLTFFFAFLFIAALVVSKELIQSNENHIEYLRKKLENEKLKHNDNVVECFELKSQNEKLIDALHAETAKRIYFEKKLDSIQRKAEVKQ